MSATGDSGAVQIYKDGLLLKSTDKKRKSWNQKWIILTKGALFIYRKKTNFAPSGEVELRDFELEDNVDGKIDKKYVFALKRKDRTKRLLFSAATEQEKTEWIEQIKQQLDKAPSQPPENVHAKGKGAKYTIQSNVASSIIGRKLLKEAVDADSWKALDAIYGFLKKSKGEDVANKFKKDLIRIGTKLAILYNNKLVTDDALEKMSLAVRHLAQTVVDYYQMPSIFDAPTLITYFAALRSATEPHFENKIKPKTMQKYKDLFEVACSEELLVNFFEKGKWPELEELSTIIRKHITRR